MPSNRNVNLPYSLLDSAEKPSAHGVPVTDAAEVLAPAANVNFDHFCFLGAVATRFSDDTCDRGHFGSEHSPSSRLSQAGTATEVVAVALRD